MNTGQCPYDDCGAFMMLAVPDETPAFAKLTCDECNRTVWYRFSRIDPEAWTVADFLAAHDVDEEAKIITPKDRRDRT